MRQTKEDQYVDLTWEEAEAINPECSVFFDLAGVVDVGGVLKHEHIGGRSARLVYCLCRDRAGDRLLHEEHCLRFCVAHRRWERVYDLAERYVLQFREHIASKAYECGVKRDDS